MSDDTGSVEYPRLPKDIGDRLKRGKNRNEREKAKREECWSFFRGNHYAYLDDRGRLQFRATGTTVGAGGYSGKPPWRVRQSRGILVDLIENEVASAVSRTPAYEVAPATVDQQDVDAARLAGKIALYGHDKWDIRRVTEDCVTHAIVGDEGFAWPYFDNTIGPYIQGAEEGVGEINIRVFSAKQVYWEPSIRFHDSRWYGVEYAKSPDEIKNMPEFKKRWGGAGKEQLEKVLKPDSGDGSKGEAVLVTITEYLERPCPEYPDGRWKTIANEQEIFAERPYPCVDGGGKVLDEPVLHKLTRIPDPDNDRDMGLVRHALDLVRIYNDAGNKISEWKNHALIPQLFVTPGLLKNQRITDEPGAIYQIPQPDQNLKWRDVPPVPSELFTIMDKAKEDLARLFAQNDIPTQVEAGKAIQAWIERDQSRRQKFTAQLAEFFSRLMRHCLYLVQRHYTEERLIQIRGTTGWESLAAFQGAQLRNQCDVRVAPGSIEPRTREQVEQKIFAFADRGWINPTAAMHAIDMGSAEKLIEDVSQHVSRAHRVIERIKQGPAVLFATPPIPQWNPATGMVEKIPGWMPRRFDNLTVHKSVFETFFVTEEYERLEEPMQVAAQDYYEKVLELEAQKAFEAAQQQTMMAESQGMENAAKPQGPKATPDKTAVSENGSGPSTPNQPMDQAVPSGPTG